MSAEQQQAVLDHLDGVGEQTGLLPVDEQVVVLDTMIGRLQARQADALRALEVEGGLVGSGCKTVGSWVRVHLRRDATAHRAVRRSRVLPQLPAWSTAFAAGQVTEEHVDTLIRATGPAGCGLDAVQAHETTLLELAMQATPRELREALELLADLVRPDRDADKVDALAGRSFTASAVGDLVHVEAMVEPSVGEALKTAVEAGARKEPGTEDPRSLRQRYADAFSEIVLRGIGAEQETHTGRLRPQVALTVSMDWLLSIEGAPKPLLDHFGVLPPSTVHRLICDGDLTRVILDTATGKPLNVGRRHRLALRRQRRALGLIFGTCAFPGCTVPFRFTEIHHRDWWCRDTGATDLDLLLPYCWSHHHFLHEYGYTVTVDHHHGAETLVHRRPDGRIIPDPNPPLHRTIDQLRLHDTDPPGADPPDTS